jgi:hypothetical protein
MGLRMKRALALSAAVIATGDGGCYNMRLETLASREEGVLFAVT